MIPTRSSIMVAALVLGSSVAAAQPAVKPAATDYSALAEKIITVSAHVKEGEIVQISGGALDLPLLEDLAIAVRKHGGFPLVTIDSDKIQKAANTQVAEKYDAQSPKLGLELAQVVDVYIRVPAVRDPGIAAMLAPARAAKRAKAAQAVDERIRARNARVVELDNGLAPSWTRANNLGVSEAELARIFWEALNSDYAVVEKKCKGLRDAVASANKVRITAPNGTDIELAVKGRNVFASDGVTSDADVRAGGPRTQVWLPAGDVYVAPIPGSANGRIVDDRMVYLGKEILGVVADIARGRVTSVDATSGWDAVKGAYAAAGRGKTEVGFVDLGCNPAIKTAGKLETWMGAGMVTIGIGGNRWAGGSNTEPFSLAYQLPGATVTLDGKVIVENGQLR